MADTPNPPSELISFLENLDEPHILCDRHYRILAANDAFRSKWVSDQDVVGRTCYDVSHRYTVPCDQAGESCPLQRSLISGQRERVTHVHHTRLGEHFENIELSPIRDGRGEIVFYIEKLEPFAVTRCDNHAYSLIGRSPPFLNMMEMIGRVAPSDAAVLLQGESGTGKEVAANAIHQFSRRAERPFVAVDCSGLAETLFESELFGHERGAFTGATARKTGLIEAASGGTLFLDEVGDIPLSIQVKLLRLLETGTFRRVGSPELRQAEIRIISATHRPLAEMIEKGSFRQDLFYRLNVFPILLPALRDRGEDVILLAESLLHRVAGGRTLRLSAAAIDWLRGYAFPGNVRELRNMLERACLLCDGDEIQLSHLSGGQIPLSLAPPSGEKPRKARKPKLDDRELADEIRRFDGSRRALAQHLGMSERTLYRRMSHLTEGPPTG